MSAQNHDLIGQLLNDHKQVEERFARFDSSDRSGWSRMFSELTGLLVQHEVAEEEILFPEVRRALPDGDRLADERIHEQSEAEELLKKMERTGADDESFSGMLTKLRGSVLEHAQKEEDTVFSPLGEALGRDRLNQLGDQYEKAKSLAPTHPHPEAPDTPPGNLAANPLAAVIDRFRDAVRRSSHSTTAHD